MLWRELKVKHLHVEDAQISRRMEDGMAGETKLPLALWRSLYHPRTAEVCVLNSDSYCRAEWALNRKGVPVILPMGHFTGNIRQSGRKTGGKHGVPRRLAVGQRRIHATPPRPRGFFEKDHQKRLFESARHSTADLAAALADKGRLCIQQ